MPEVPLPGQHHRQSALVSGGDDFVVAHGAAGLNHGADAGVGEDVEAVAEREECIGRGERVFRRQDS